MEPRNDHTVMCPAKQSLMAYAIYNHEVNTRNIINKPTGNKNTT